MFQTLFLIFSLGSLFASGKIAIIIDDLGNSREGDREFIALPSGVTLAFLPDGVGLRDLLEEGRERGHEILAHVPMEALKDPSPLRQNLLMVTDTPDTLREKLEWHLEQVGECVGVNNHTGSYFTSSSKPLEVVMRVLKERGLFFLDSRTSAASKAKEVAAEAGVPCLVNDLFLDREETTEHVRHQLRCLEAIADRRGYAIAIGHPKRSTLLALKEWLGETPKELVPLSALFQGSPSP